MDASAVGAPPFTATSSPSMFVSTTASCRRLRAKPSVASIAELFVSSLVTASLCREHRAAPPSVWRDRAIKHRMRNWLPGSTKRTTKSLGGKRMTPCMTGMELKRMFSSGLPQVVEDFSSDGRKLDNGGQQSESEPRESPGLSSAGEEHVAVVEKQELENGSLSDNNARQQSGSGSPGSAREEEELISAMEGQELGNEFDGLGFDGFEQQSDSFFAGEEEFIAALEGQEFGTGSLSDEDVDDHGQQSDSFFSGEEEELIAASEGQQLGNGSLSDKDIHGHWHTINYRVTDPLKESILSTSTLLRDTIGDKLEWKDMLDSITSKRAPAAPWSREAEKEERIRRGWRDAVEIPAVRKFVTALADERKSNQYIFRLYRDIPSPGVERLSKRSRGILLRRLSAPSKRRRIDMLRYMALLEDMLVAGFPLSRSLWTSAIHLAGRCLPLGIGRVGSIEVERAIGVWRKMEHLGGIKADDAVFGVLFDVAVRAEQYTVAERLIKEMKARNVDFARFGKVSYIFYKGALGDVDGIREAFAGFVASGEIVDTVVLNCLITSFMWAGDFQTAERIYERMLKAQRSVRDIGLKARSHDPILSLEFSDYRNRTKKLGQVLQQAAALSNISPEHHRTLQDALPLTPDSRTFHIMLCHYARRTGNLTSLMSTLKDMAETYDTPPRFLVYVLIFDGFARFGGWKKQWSAEKLRETWVACSEVLLDSRERYAQSFIRRPIGKVHRSIDETGDHSDRFAESDTDDPMQAKRAEQMELEQLDKVRLVNDGLFLGPRIIISILRAFGACCSRDELLDVWLQIEVIWESHKRKLTDVEFVTNELNRQIARTSGQPWRGRGS